LEIIHGLTEAEVLNALCEVIDPELGMNILRIAIDWRFQ
jgi:hypothetical protein